MVNKKSSKKPDPNTLMECMKCKRTYTLHMMLQIYSWLDDYKCIRCYNKGELKNDYYAKNELMD